MFVPLSVNNHQPSTLKSTLRLPDAGAPVRTTGSALKFSARMDSKPDSNDEKVGSIRIASQYGYPVEARVVSSYKHVPQPSVPLKETLSVFVGERCIGQMILGEEPNAPYLLNPAQQGYLSVDLLMTNHWTYKGIGTALIRAAVTRSHQFGYDGRLALDAIIWDEHLFQQCSIQPPEFRKQRSRIRQSPVPFYDALGFECEPALQQKIKPAIQHYRTRKKHIPFPHHAFGKIIRMALPTDAIARLTPRKKEGPDLTLHSLMKDKLEARRNIRGQ